MRPVYCVPSEAGLASEGRSVARRLGKLLSALDGQVNAWVIDGPMVNELWEFKAGLIEKLKADGWRVEAKDAGGYRVLVPRGYLK